MKLARPRRRAMPETIIALVDVVFFLLVFFMLIGRMDATAPFDVLPPEAATGSTMPGGGLTVSVSADGELALDGVALEAPEVLTRIEAGLSTAPETLVRVNAHKDANLGAILPLVTEIRKTGARDVVLVVTPAGQ